MNVVIAGGSGFIGSRVARRFAERGDQVSILTRTPSRVKTGTPVEWEPGLAGPWQRVVAEADAVINLAGENIGARRWTDERKKVLRDSRLRSTEALVELIRNHRKANRVLVNASAVGYYGPRGDEILSEQSAAGKDFLAELVRAWEQSAKRAEDAARVVILRFGIVLAADGGALQRMLLPFRLFAGGRLGTGRQYMSWVDRDDVVSMIEWAVDQEKARGAYNVTAPSPVTNADFTEALGRALKRPAIIPAPALALYAAFGEMANALLLSGQRVVPRRALDDGFQFRYASLDASLKHSLEAGGGA